MPCQLKFMKKIRDRWMGQILRYEGLLPGIITSADYGGYGQPKLPRAGNKLANSRIIKFRER